MTYRELSIAFDVYSNRHAEVKLSSLLFFDEYEKSLFLTMAANEIVKEMLPYFDKNEKIKKQLLSITRAVQISTPSSVDNDLRLKKDSLVYELPSDVMYVVAESIRTSLGAILMRIKPLQDDEAYYSFDNPFRASTRGYAWSTGISQSVGGTVKRYTEVITSVSSSVSPEYYIKYVCDVPPFIVTEDLMEGIVSGQSTNSNLDADAPLKPLHEKILNRAIEIGYMAKADDPNAKANASNLSHDS
jgi:hypothetical protein